ncbi:IgA FC receptor [Zootermopsis nevadensis]|uniref:IgA FC receptor n=1 Tax=Zootermopsis nevadensis TaxID=136037 RepID=A0A067R6W4_ZOONE|nr:IgA FC receptor [Zootermopsis nevadensis]
MQHHYTQYLPSFLTPSFQRPEATITFQEKTVAWIKEILGQQSMPDVPISYSTNDVSFLLILICVIFFVKFFSAWAHNDDPEVVDDPRVDDDPEVDDDPRVDDDPEVDDDLEVVDDPRVDDDPEVDDDLEVVDDPRVDDDPEVDDDLEVVDDPRVDDDSEVVDDRRVDDDPEVVDNPRVDDDPEVVDDSEVYDDPEVDDELEVNDEFKGDKVKCLIKSLKAWIKHRRTVNDILVKMFSKQQEVINGQQDVIKALVEMLQNTGWRNVNDRSTSMSEVSDSVHGGNDEEA